MSNGHGGARINSGRPRKAFADAIIDGTRKSRIKTVKLEGTELLDANTPTVPEVMEYLKTPQKDGEAILSEIFFSRIYKWLSERKCEKLIEADFLQRFALQQARYVQIENLISKTGFLAKSSSGTAIESPLESMALNRLKIVNQMQQAIENIVRANCETPYTGFPNCSDPMEQLLSGR
jgi:hypothetical protein